MKKNNLKKLATGAVVLLLSVGTMAGNKVLGVDGHEVPGCSLEKPVYCNNTYRTYKHMAYIATEERGQHIVSGGIGCTISAKMYAHNILCSRCGAIMGQKYFFCTEIHTQCGNSKVNHPAY